MVRRSFLGIRLRLPELIGDWGLVISDVEVSRNAFYGYHIASEVLGSEGQ